LNKDSPSKFNKTKKKGSAFIHSRIFTLHSVLTNYGAALWKAYTACFAVGLASIRDEDFAAAGVLTGSTVMEPGDA
jgi:hypothetical protein